MRLPKPKLRYIAVTSAAYGLALIYTAPASLLQRLPGAATQLQMENPRGTLWSGTLDNLRIHTAYGQTSISNVQWQWQWQSLLQGALAFRMESADAVGSLTLSMSRQGLRLAHIDLSLPAVELARMMPTLALLQPGGEVRVTGEASLTPLPTGHVELFWNNAAINLTPAQPLGNYHLRWSGTPQGGRFEVQTLQGMLFLEGTGETTHSHGWRFQGIAQTESQQAAQLRPLLEKIGALNTDGAYHIQLSGN